MGINEPGTGGPTPLNAYDVTQPPTPEEIEEEKKITKIQKEAMDRATAEAKKRMEDAKWEKHAPGADTRKTA